jgi:hypothetical protein
MTLIVNRIGDCHDVIVPFFERYKLRSKKNRDFTIWREIVSFCHVIKKSPPKIIRRYGAGCVPKWTPHLLEQATMLVNKLKAIRKYAEPSVMPKTVIMTKPNNHEQPTLFD